MDSEVDDHQNPVQDGLQNAHSPISRDPKRTDDERAEDRAADTAEDEAEREAEGTAEGVNEAPGPAEDEDTEGDDDRKLTTDTSPSD